MDNDIHYANTEKGKVETLLIANPDNVKQFESDDEQPNEIVITMNDGSDPTVICLSYKEIEKLYNFMNNINKGE